MPKETIFLFIITVLILTAGTCFSQNRIQTTQRLIVIDPGHGGSSNGIVTSSGTTEKTIALKLAQKTARKLESRYNVVLTRTDDSSISPRERVFIANKNKADLFLSIHLNNSREPEGFFFYFESPETDTQKPLGSGTDWKLQPLFHQAESRQVIASFLKIFSDHRTADLFFSRAAPIILLEGTTMPAILIEPFAMSILPHTPDEIDAILDSYAGLITKSIDHYFEK